MYGVPTAPRRVFGVTHETRIVLRKDLILVELDQAPDTTAGGIALPDATSREQVISGTVMGVSNDVGDADIKTGIHVVIDPDDIIAEIPSPEPDAPAHLQVLPVDAVLAILQQPGEYDAGEG